MVRGALNIPAQSLPLPLPTWVDAFGHRTIVFYCSSSKGRGPRSAAFYQEFLDSNSCPGKAMVLEGAINAWTKTFSGSQMVLHVRISNRVRRRAYAQKLNFAFSKTRSLPFLKIAIQYHVYSKPRTWVNTMQVISKSSASIEKCEGRRD